MLTSYKTLFTCQALHSFFADNICKGIAFTPGKKTMAITRRFELLFAPAGNGFSMFATCNNAIPDFLRYVTNTTGLNYFDFEMVVDDSSFNNYTDVPVDWAGQFQFSSGDAVARAGSAIILKTILSAGTPQPRGVIKISFDDIASMADEPPVYTIQFSARLTRWDYYLIVRNKDIDQDSLTLKSKDSMLVNGPQQVKTAAGEAAVLFTVDKLIALSEQPKYSFDLVTTGGKHNRPGERYDRVIYKGLPAPGRSNIGLVKDDKKTLVTSPMYVYI